MENCRAKVSGRLLSHVSFMRLERVFSYLWNNLPDNLRTEEVRFMITVTNIETFHDHLAHYYKVTVVGFVVVAGVVSVVGVV